MSLLLQVLVEFADRGQVAIDSLGVFVSVQQMIDIRRNPSFTDLLNRHVDPQEELFEIIQVALDRVGGVISSVQVSLVAQDRVGNVHGLPPFPGSRWL